MSMATEQQPDLYALADSVAAELSKLDGHAWERVTTHEDDYRHAGQIARVDDPAVMLWIHGRGWTHDPTKVEIHGDYPRTETGEYIYIDHEDRTKKNPEIRVSWARGADVVAREISRRLLPGYLERLTKVRERVAETDNREALRKQLAETFAASIGSTARHDRHDSRIYQSNGPTWEVQGDRFYIVHRVGMTLEQATKVAEIMREET